MTIIRHKGASCCIEFSFSNNGDRLNSGPSVISIVTGFVWAQFQNLELEQFGIRCIQIDRTSARRFHQENLGGLYTLQSRYLYFYQQNPQSAPACCPSPLQLAPRLGRHTSRALAAEPDVSSRFVRANPPRYFLGECCVRPPSGPPPFPKMIHTPARSLVNSLPAISFGTHSRRVPVLRRNGPALVWREDYTTWPCYGRASVLAKSRI